MSKDFKERLAANHWISARASYTPVYGDQAPCVNLRRHAGEHPMALTPSEARELAMALIAAADFSEGL